MSSVWPHGTFCWVEHATTDLEASKGFYKDILGMATKEVPMPGAGAQGTYTMWVLDGDKEIGGAHTLGDEEKAAGVPPHWTPYIAVDGLDDIAAKVERLGGKLLAKPFDIPDTGRMAVAADPTGATFAMWSRQSAHGGGHKPEGLGALGMPCWNELLTTNVDKAGAFYAELLGWTHKVSEMPGGAYTLFKNGDVDVAGMMAIAKEWGPIPPHWNTYFVVADIDKTAAMVAEKGGKVTSPVLEVPGIGRFAMLLDPRGAAFSAIQPPAPCQ